MRYIFRAVALFVVAITPLRANSPEWTYLDQSTQFADFSVLDALADPQGFWLSGTAQGKGAIVRYDNALHVLYARYGEYGRLAGVTHDGGFVSVLISGGEQTGPRFTVERFNPDASVRWTYNVGVYCVLLGVDADGGMWFGAVSGILFRIAADGVGVARGEGFDVTAGGVNKSNGSLYVAVQHDANDAASAPATGIVELKPRDTTVLGPNSPLPPFLWTTPDASAHIGYVGVGTDSNIYALASNAAGIFAISLTPSGSVRWQHAFTAGTNEQISASTSYPDGSLVAVDQADNLIVIANDGSLKYSKNIRTANTCPEIVDCPVNVTALANGELLVLSGDLPQHLLRFDAGGSLLADTTLGAEEGADTVAVLADDSAVTPIPLAHVARNGQGLALPPTANLLHDVGGAAGGNLAGQAQAADGSLYLFTIDAGDGAAWLSKISASGQLVWKQPATSITNVRDLRALSDRICWGGSGLQQQAISCASTATGDLLWTYPVDGSLFAAIVLDDGSILAAVTPGSAATVEIHLDAGGALISSTTLGHHFFTNKMQFAKNGTLIISDIHENNGVFAWDLNGHAIYALSTFPGGGATLDDQMVVGDDGSAVLGVVSVSSTLEYLWSISPTGVTRWTQAQSYAYLMLDKIYNDSVYVLRSQNFSTATQASSISLSDVSVQHTVTVDGSYPLFDTATGLLVSEANYGAAHISIFDAANGNLLNKFALDCGDATCVRFVPVLSADNTLRIVQDIFNPSVGAQVRVTAFAAVNVAAPAIRVDQAGLDGAWYPTYAAGQGFTLDYLASAHTIFMPWFTFGTDQINDPDNLRWYALQGTANAGDKSSTMAIAETDPGVFASGTVAGHVIGSAQLSFTDCNNGLLDYLFTDGVHKGLSGSVRLSRLTPSTAACTLADGSMVAAENSNPPAQGFDARQNGSWFDPATSGQGFEMTIVPPGNGSAGLAFLAWFTFDPAGLGDDPVQQHWFTLQGDLSTASNGVVTLPVYRIIGGTFNFTPTSNYVEVGHATLRMAGCDTAQIDYQFDDSEVAHAFSALSGSLHLTKIGGCSAQ